MSTNARLAALRTLLHGALTQDAWQSICALLRGWPPDDGLDVALDYAERHLTRWPDPLRVAPRAWWEDLLTTAPLPGWSLMRELRLPAGVASISEELRALLSLNDQARFTALKLTNATPTDDEFAQLLSSPCLDGLHLLDLSRTPVGQASMPHLASSPALKTLTHLLLSEAHVEPAGCQALLSSPELNSAALRVLDLSRNRLDAGWAAATFRRAEGLSGLTSLNLRHCPLGAEGLEALAQTPWLSNLEALYLGHCNEDWSQRGLEALAASQSLARLTHLDLADNDIGNLGALTLSRTTTLTRLETLELQRNRIGAEGMFALARSSLLPNLRSFNLRGNNIGPDGAMALFQAPQLALTHLDLSYNAIGLQGIEALANSPHLEHLEHLNLYKNSALANFHDNTTSLRGIEALTRSPHLAWLNRLNLGFNAVGDAGVELLTTSPHLTRLRHLDLTYNQIGTPGALFLARSPLLLQLDSFQLDGNRIGPEGIEALQHALADLPEQARMLPLPQTTWEEDEPPDPSVPPEERPDDTLREILRRFLGG